MRGHPMERIDRDNQRLLANERRAEFSGAPFGDGIHHTAGRANTCTTGVRAQQASKGAGPRRSVHTKLLKGCQVQAALPILRAAAWEREHCVHCNLRLFIRRTHAIRHKPSCCRNVSILLPRLFVTPAVVHKSGQKYSFAFYCVLIQL